jgi:hypothetical protein
MSTVFNEKQNFYTKGIVQAEGGDGAEVGRELTFIESIL